MWFNIYVTAVVALTLLALVFRRPSWSHRRRLKALAVAAVIGVEAVAMFLTGERPFFVGGLAVVSGVCLVIAVTSHDQDPVEASGT